MGQSFFRRLFFSSFIVVVGIGIISTAQMSASDTSGESSVAAKLVKSMVDRWSQDTTQAVASDALVDKPASLLDDIASLEVRVSAGSVAEPLPAPTTADIAKAPDVPAHCASDGLSADAVVIGDKLKLRFFERASLGVQTGRGRARAQGHCL